MEVIVLGRSSMAKLNHGETGTLTPALLVAC